jgi:L-ascorbate metabolism protein UlaG (beta-lactamase superfamily)
MNTIGRIGVGMATLFLCAGTSQGQGKASGSPVTVQFWGHACFTITTAGKTLLIDPYSPQQVGYTGPDVSPDLVLITHEHFDHSDTSWVKGKPLVLRGLEKGGQVQAIDRTVGPFHVRTVPARHWDAPAQKQRGNIAMFVIEVAGLKIVHVGDLGEKLSAEQAKAIGKPDVLMVPVGGFFTIDAEQAYEVVQQLKPRAHVIPMHYRTPALPASLQSKLAEPRAFLQKFGEQVVRLGTNELKIDPAALPAEMEVVLMDYQP